MSIANRLQELTDENDRLRKENAILDKELVRHIKHASELIAQVERKQSLHAALKRIAAQRPIEPQLDDFSDRDGDDAMFAYGCAMGAFAMSEIARLALSSDERA